ncbi:hypothetical protein THAOC_07061, partial [Thalassiosira oceanica]
MFCRTTTLITLTLSSKASRNRVTSWIFTFRWHQRLRDPLRLTCQRSVGEAMMDLFELGDLMVNLEVISYHTKSKADTVCENVEAIARGSVQYRLFRHEQSESARSGACVRRGMPVRVGEHFAEAEKDRASSFFSVYACFPSFISRPLSLRSLPIPIIPGPLPSSPSARGASPSPQHSAHKNDSQTHKKKSRVGTMDLSTDDLLRGLVRRVDELEAARSDLASRVEALRGDNDSLRRETRGLQQVTGRLKQKVDGLTRDNAILREEIASLKYGESTAAKSRKRPKTEHLALTT